MTIKFSFCEAEAYPMAVDKEPSIPLVPRLQQTSRVRCTIVRNVRWSYSPDARPIQPEASVSNRRSPPFRSKRTPAPAGSGICIPKPSDIQSAYSPAYKRFSPETRKGPSRSPWSGYRINPLPLHPMRHANAP